MNSLKDKAQFKSSSKGIIYYSIIAALLIISSSLYASYDQEKKYKWGGGASSPEGYPVEVTVGGFSYRALSFGLVRGPWGEVSYLGGDGYLPLPRKLVAEWVSFGEGEHGKAYQIKADLDYEKMEKLFDEGYELQFANGRPNEIENYGNVVAGFAPGGVVVVWVKGIGRKIEIGRYQGYEVTPEDSNLYPETLELLTPYWNAAFMNNVNVVPTNVREANKGKKAPYGLWDSLRQRFNYTVKVVCADGGKFIGGDIRYVNGEIKDAFPTAEGEALDLKEEAAPRRILVIWHTAKGEGVGARIYLEEVYSLELFRQMQEGDKTTEIELTIRVNEANDECTLVIKNNKGKEQLVKLDPLKEIEIF